MTRDRQAQGFASAVSRNLRKRGIIPARSDQRGGVHVRAVTPAAARVVVILGGPTVSRAVTDKVVAALHDHGYRTTRLDDWTVHVHRGGTSNHSTDQRTEAI